MRVRVADGFVLAEVTDPPFELVHAEEVYIALIERAFGNKGILSISQKIDVTQWRIREPIGEPGRFADDIRQRFTTRAVLTADYDDPTPPPLHSDIFVIHVVNSPDRGLLQTVLGFGMFNLPNIIYALRAVPQNWPQEILEWNRTIVTWFHLKASDAAVGRLIQEVGSICLTIDGHLWFGFQGRRELDSLLTHVNELAQVYALELKVEEGDANHHVQILGPL